MEDSGSGRVACYAGHAYPGEPRAFDWQGAWWRVTTVEARWRTPDGPAFRVESASGARFELHYHERADRWTIRKLADLPATAAGNLGQGGPVNDA